MENKANLLVLKVRAIQLISYAVAVAQTSKEQENQKAGTPEMYHRDIVHWDSAATCFPHPPQNKGTLLRG